MLSLDNQESDIKMSNVKVPFRLRVLTWHRCGRVDLYKLHMFFSLGIIGIWTLPMYKITREHSVSEAGSVSFLG